MAARDESADLEVMRCAACGTANRVPRAKLAQGLRPRCGRCHAPLLDDGHPVTVTDASFAAIVAASPIPVLLDMWAPWCGPCRAVSPALEQLARDLAGQVKLVKVNVDTSPQISQRFGAQAIPTLLVLRGGQVAARQTGAAPLAALRSWVENALATTAG